MSDQNELTKAIKALEELFKVKEQQVKEAAENIETVRQVQTESPNR